MKKIKQLRRILLLDGCLLLGLLCAGPLAAWMLRWLPFCPIADLGYQCAACGSTRCILALSRLQFSQAFSFHPLLCLLIGYGFLGLIALHLGHLGQLRPFQRLFAWMTDYRAIIAWAVVYGLFAILRNM